VKLFYVLSCELGPTRLRLF